MNHSKKRRFIAGAVCPRCSAMDTVMMFQEKGVDVRQCVECDFEEKANFNNAQSSASNNPMVEKELPTRVNKEMLDVEAKEKIEQGDDLQVVKIIGSAPLKDNES
ncbi:MAG: YheV family putative zinc ribbon protein [Cellvibrionaceae bacterium]